MHSGLAIEDIAHPLAGCTTNGRRGLNCRMCGSLNVRLIRFTSSSVEGHRVSSHESFFPVTLTAGGRHFGQHLGGGTNQRSAAQGQLFRVQVGQNWSRLDS